jgi:hypothetical protein
LKDRVAEVVKGEDLVKKAVAGVRLSLKVVTFAPTDAISVKVVPSAAVNPESISSRVVLPGQIVRVELIAVAVRLVGRAARWNRQTTLSVKSPKSP